MSERSQIARAKRIGLLDVFLMEISSTQHTWKNYIILFLKILNKKSAGAASVAGGACLLFMQTKQTAKKIYSVMTFTKFLV